MKKVISIFLVAQIFIFATYLISSAVFANVEVAFMSAFLVILGSSFAYSKMVDKQVASEQYEDKRDLLDEIEDPHELYDDEPLNMAPAEDLDLKQIVKQEKAKIKTFSLKSAKHGAKGSVSALRLVPYVLLVLGFIALKNNDILDLRFYLPALTFGIIIGSLSAKEVLA
ncbi:hypothetical protein [Sulfurimonas sp.]|uniref:hypothetical protein n=1 Tax=Sulfurimonas sp. TaxID=2022749 RepID=UPI00261C48C7|nr:hypothetical protein [Sulfurimonas sp.]